MRDDHLWDSFSPQHKKPVIDMPEIADANGFKTECYAINNYDVCVSIRNRNHALPINSLSTEELQPEKNKTNRKNSINDYKRKKSMAPNSNDRPHRSRPRANKPVYHTSIRKGSIVVVDDGETDEIGEIEDMYVSVNTQTRNEKDPWELLDEVQPKQELVDDYDSYVDLLNGIVLILSITFLSSMFTYTSPTIPAINPYVGIGFMVIVTVVSFMLRTTRQKQKFRKLGIWRNAYYFMNVFPFMMYVFTMLVLNAVIASLWQYGTFYYSDYYIVNDAVFSPKWYSYIPLVLASATIGTIVVIDKKKNYKTHPTIYFVIPILVMTGMLGFIFLSFHNPVTGGLMIKTSIRKAFFTTDVVVGYFTGLVMLSTTDMGLIVFSSKNTKEEIIA